MDMRAVSEQDIEEIKGWLRLHKQSDIDERHLDPQGGLIVPGVMVMFYTMTNRSMMWVDTLISNPYAELSARHEAGKLFASALYEIAKANKIKRMYFLTRNKAVARYYAKCVFATKVNDFELYKTEFIWD